MPLHIAPFLHFVLGGDKKLAAVVLERERHVAADRVMVEKVKRGQDGRKLV